MNWENLLSKGMDIAGDIVGLKVGNDSGTNPASTSQALTTGTKGATSSGGMSTGAMVGIGIAVVAVLGLGVVLITRK